MRDVPSVERSRERREESGLRSREHRHAIERDTMFEVELVDLSGDPLSLLHLLAESKHLDGSVRRVRA